MKEWVITTVIALGIGVVSYFLKRTMSQVDRHDTEIREGREQSASKEDLKEQTKELKDDIRKIREDYTPRDTHQKDFDECRKDIKEIRENYLTKDDFIREISKMDRKLDRMMEMMIEAAKKG